MIAKIALITVFLIRANCFYLKQEFKRPSVFKDLDDFYSEQQFEYVQPVLVRQRRQVYGEEYATPVYEKLNFGAGSTELALDNIKKVEAPLGVAHTPQRQNNDYSPFKMGELSLFVDSPLPSSYQVPSTFVAGTSQSISNRSWQPFGFQRIFLK